MRNRACRDNELAGVASCNRKLLESQQCLLLTKSVLSVRMQMRTMQGLAGLRDPMFHWGLEFSVISNSFQQKAQQWHFLTGHLSQGARPGADEGNSEVFWFEQMNPRVTNLGTWILRSSSVLCVRRVFTLPASLPIRQRRERFRSQEPELHLLLKPLALLLRSTSPPRTSPFCICAHRNVESCTPRQQE